MDSPMIRVLKYLEAGNEIVAKGLTGNTHYRFSQKRGIIWAYGEDRHNCEPCWKQFGCVLASLATLESFLPNHFEPEQIEDTRSIEI